MKRLVEYECPECGANSWAVVGDVATCLSCGFVQEGVINHIDADVEEAKRQLKEIQKWLSTVTTAKSTDDLK